MSAVTKLPVAKKEPDAPALPSRVRLQHAYGYVEDETGRKRMWAAGDLIVDAHEIALLVGRGAPVDSLDPVDPAE